MITISVPENEALLKILCEINNRLNEIAITLQTDIYLKQQADDIDKSIQKMRELLTLMDDQKEKYMSITPIT